MVFLTANAYPALYRLRVIDVETGLKQSEVDYDLYEGAMEGAKMGCIRYAGQLCKEALTIADDIYQYNSIELQQLLADIALVNAGRVLDDGVNVVLTTKESVRRQAAMVVGVRCSRICTGAIPLKAVA